MSCLNFYSRLGFNRYRPAVDNIKRVKKHLFRHTVRGRFIRSTLSRHARCVSARVRLVAYNRGAMVDTLKMPCLWFPTRRQNVPKFGLVVLVFICLRLGTHACGKTHIYCADHENKRLIKIKEDGTLLWDCPNNNGHDVQLLKNGHVLIVTGEVQEIDAEKNIVWKVGKPAVED